MPQILAFTVALTAGALNLIQAALPLLRAHGSGHIIPVSSVAGLIAVPMAGIYEGSRFAVEGIAEALAAEAASFGIKVTLVNRPPTSAQREVIHSDEGGFTIAASYGQANYRVGLTAFDKQ